ncbi:MAG: hypothetical protein WBJ83_04655 [Thermacetogeniaceae bacterium]|nr:hypothetical protein [Syntrophomonadaceae bacterium]
MKKEDMEKLSIPVQGPTKFSLERRWNLAEDLKEKERDQLLKEISSSLKTIEKTLERIENLFRFTLFNTDIDT